VTSTKEIPENLWSKIEEFQKKGGIQNVQGMIQGLTAMRENNMSMIEQMQKTLEEEESSDNQMRTQYN
jgi:programmed cell death 6-interacting protein